MGRSRLLGPARRHGSYHTISLRQVASHTSLSRSPLWLTDISPACGVLLTPV